VCSLLANGYTYINCYLSRYLDRPPAENDIHPRFPSPAYPGLVGNVLPEFLSYHGFPFPPPAEYDPENRQPQPFPTLTETRNYLKAFAKPFIEDGRLRLTKEVVRVEERPVSPGGDGNTKDKWRVILRDWADPANPGKELEELWDAVVVCVGWYDNPLWPDTQGLEQVKEKGLARHARAWRGPEGWEAKVCTPLHARPNYMTHSFTAHSCHRECQLI